jgi:hypothetical protein
MHLNTFERLFNSIAIERGVSSDYFTLRRTDTALHNRLPAIESRNLCVRHPAPSRPFVPCPSTNLVFSASSAFLRWQFGALCNPTAWVGPKLPVMGLLDNFGCRTWESVERAFAYARSRLVNRDWGFRIWVPGRDFLHRNVDAWTDAGSHERHHSLDHVSQHP